jgi:hypothetical protein
MVLVSTNVVFEVVINVSVRVVDLSEFVEKLVSVAVPVRVVVFVVAGIVTGGDVVGGGGELGLMVIVDLVNDVTTLDDAVLRRVLTRVVSMTLDPVETKVCVVPGFVTVEVTLTLMIVGITMLASFTPLFPAFEDDDVDPGAFPIFPSLTSAVKVFVSVSSDVVLDFDTPDLVGAEVVPGCDVRLLISLLVPDVRLVAPFCGDDDVDSFPAALDVEAVLGSTLEVSFALSAGAVVVLTDADPDPLVPGSFAGPTNVEVETLFDGELVDAVATAVVVVGATAVVIDAVLLAVFTTTEVDGPPGKDVDNIGLVEPPKSPPTPDEPVELAVLALFALPQISGA